MKDRILQIMQWQNMSQTEFATAIQISTASLSSIINGHNNPTMKYVYSIRRRFPEINTEWLLDGTGEMLKPNASASGKANVPNGDAPEVPISTQQGGSEPTLDLFSQAQSQDQNPTSRSSQRTQKSTSVAVEGTKNVDRRERRIKEIRIYFDDDTYETFADRI